MEAHHARCHAECALLYGAQSATAAPRTAGKAINLVSGVVGVVRRVPRERSIAGSG